MVALLLISKVGEYVAGGVAIALLAMGTFGLDSMFFSKKRAATRDPRAPKQRIHFVVEEEPTEPEPTKPQRTKP
jgi:hypothetical protein